MSGIKAKNLREWLPKFYSLRSLESTLAMSTPYEAAAAFKYYHGFLLMLQSVLVCR